MFRSAFPTNFFLKFTKPPLVKLWQLLIKTTPALKGPQVVCLFHNLSTTCTARFSMLENWACLLAEVSIPETKTLRCNHIQILLFAFRRKFLCSFRLGAVRPGRNPLHENQVDDLEVALQLTDLRSLALYICSLTAHIARYFKPINLRSDGISSLKLKGNLSLKGLF